MFLTLRAFIRKSNIILLNYHIGNSSNLILDEKYSTSESLESTCLLNVFDISEKHKLLGL